MNMKQLETYVNVRIRELGEEILNNVDMEVGQPQFSISASKREELVKIADFIKNESVECLVCASEECIVDSEYTTVYITKNELRNRTQTPDGESIKIDYEIDYCPKCGRKLL